MNIDIAPLNMLNIMLYMEAHKQDIEEGVNDFGVLQGALKDLFPPKRKERCHNCGEDL